MNIMIIGGGGREHVIAKYVAKSPKVSKLYALPGNGGISQLAECVNISAEDIDAIVDFAKTHAIDFAIVAPDDPLALGAVDRLESVGVKCFGPDQKAAMIESSKVFAKDFMIRNDIPTAKYEIFTELDAALSYAAKSDCPIVIKADGLAKGKGVTVAENFMQARDAILSCMRDKAFGNSGSRILIEECLAGPEVTVLAFTDGNVIVPMMSSMDHKRAYDGNKGPNTGGMGVAAPNRYYTPEIAEECMQRIFLPTMNAMKREGRVFKGCLYFGLMLTQEGPKVIEYNCRFGDPEAEAVLPLLDGDLLEIMLAVRDERLADVKIKFRPEASCCVILASGGYPGTYMKGCEISFGNVSELANVCVFHCGTKLEGDKFLTSGGRVLAITATGKDFAEARERAYEAVKCVDFQGMHYRTDIGAH